MFIIKNHIQVCRDTFNLGNNSTVFLHEQAFNKTLFINSTKKLVFLALFAI